MKEYKTLYFNDTKTGRKEMQAEFDRLSVAGWRVNDTQAIDRGYGIGGAILLGLAGKRKAKLMIVMERERGGNYPTEPALPQSAREVRRVRQEETKDAINDRAEQLINKVIPGYADFRKKYHK
ncbi:MAG: hypothetical protein JWN01_170 [Patescibacteria group bacterium]|nr:hypothetical protein [Patescibacteria group bacterium]